MDKLFRKAFEQLALENLSEAQFKVLTGGYEAEKQELLALTGKLEQEISSWEKHHAERRPLHGCCGQVHGYSGIDA